MPRTATALIRSVWEKLILWKRNEKKSTPYPIPNHMNNWGGFYSRNFRVPLHFNQFQCVCPWTKTKTTENTLKILYTVKWFDKVAAKMVVVAAATATAAAAAIVIDVIIAWLMDEWGKETISCDGEQKADASQTLHYTIVSNLYIYIWIFSMVSPFVEIAWDAFAC